jgi:hypothetical protein
MIAYFSIVKLLVLSGPKLALRKHRTRTVHKQVSGSLLKRRRKKAYIFARTKLGMVGKVLGIALLLAGCATSPPMDEAKIWVDRLSPNCESAGFEEWTSGWIQCIQANYAARSTDRLERTRDAMDAPARTLTYCAVTQGDGYRCLTF